MKVHTAEMVIICTVALAIAITYSSSYYFTYLTTKQAMENGYHQEYGDGGMKWVK